MNDDHRRLSPYVRDEETLQRGIEQTALAQTRAAMSDDKATELRGMVNYLLEQAQRREDEAARHPADSPTRTHFAAMAEADRDTATELGILARQLAQAHADQQARLRGLVEGWRGRTEQCIEQAEKAKGRSQRESWISTEIATRNCADELDAVLGKQ